MAASASISPAVSFPLGGMNEKGLVVEIMWLDSSEYPKPDGKPSVNELQWIQYQLDNFATVNDVLSAAAKIRVSKVYAASSLYGMRQYGRLRHVRVRRRTAGHAFRTSRCR